MENEIRIGFLCEFSRCFEESFMMWVSLTNHIDFLNRSRKSPYGIEDASILTWRAEDSITREPASYRVNK